MQQASEKDRIERECEVLRVASRSDGFKVLIAKMKQVHDASSSSLSISEDNWALKRAHADGKAAAVKEILEWVAGRVAGTP